MSLTVEEALKLPCLRDAKIVAGANGINRNISRISVSECKEFPVDLSIMGNCNMLFRDEEIYLTSCYAIKDEPELLLDTVKLYSQYNSSGLIVFDRYFKTFDAAVIEYANAVNYPIISMKRETPYSDAIMEISQAILLNEGNALNETIVDEIREPKTTPRKVRALAYRLNPSFHTNNHVVCIFFGDERLKAINVMNEIEVKGSNFAMFYRNYILVFFTSNEPIGKETRKKNLKYVKSIVVNVLQEGITGVSNVHGDVAQIREAVDEAIIACETAKIKDKETEDYEDAGIYSFLMRLQGKAELRRFYEETMKDINEQNASKREEMMNILEMFVNFDGDIQRIAKETFQHVNTVRYRINKLKALLGTEGSEIEFAMTANLVDKIRKILESEGDNGS